MRVDDAGGDVQRVVLGGPVVVGDRRRTDRPGVGRHVLGERGVAVHRDAGRRERREDARQELIGDVAVHEQGLGRVADADAAASWS